MTRRLRDKEHPEANTEFSLWLRGRRNLESRLIKTSITDADYFVHNYGKHWIMLVEEKRNDYDFFGTFNFPQRDTLSCVNMMLQTASHPKAPRYAGFFIVRFSGDGPRTSDKMELLDFNNRNNSAIFSGKRSIQQALDHFIKNAEIPAFGEKKFKSRSAWKSRNT